MKNRGVCLQAFPSVLPLPLPLFHFLALGQTENLLPRSFFAPKLNGNACYADYTKRPQRRRARRNGCFRRLPSLLEIAFFLFSTRFGDLAFLRLHLFSVWLRRCVFVYICIIKFLSDRLLCFLSLCY